MTALISARAFRGELNQQIFRMVVAVEEAPLMQPGGQFSRKTGDLLSQCRLPRFGEPRQAVGDEFVESNGVADFPREQKAVANETGGANLADSFDPVGADAEPGGAFRGDSLP